MRNMLRILEVANEEGYIPFRKEELGVEPKVFSSIAKRCGFELNFMGRGVEKSVKLRKRGIPIEMLYDKDESPCFNFLDIADIHVGHIDFSPETLEAVLSKYWNKGNPIVNYVFIAGDLLEGVPDGMFSYEIVNANPNMRARLEKIMYQQVNMLFKIFSKYDFDYRVINGNHEYIFEQFGLEPPLKLLEEKMRQIGKKFKWYDTYIMDFIIAGVVKRVMHLESYHRREGAVHAYDRLVRFEKNGGLSSCYKGKKYPIRFFQCGHIHKREELYDSQNKIFISQSGSFIKREMLYYPAIHVKGVVLEDNRILRD